MRFVLAILAASICLIQLAESGGYDTYRGDNYKDRRYDGGYRAPRRYDDGYDNYPTGHGYGYGGYEKEGYYRPYDDYHGKSYKRSRHDRVWVQNINKNKNKNEEESINENESLNGNMNANELARIKSLLELDDIDFGGYGHSRGYQN